MKKILVSIAAILMAAVVAQAGPVSSMKKIVEPAKDLNWYGAVYGGVSLYQEGVKNHADVLWGFDLDQKRKTGMNFGLKFGYDFAPQDFVRPVVEFDMQYNRFNRNVDVDLWRPTSVKAKNDSLSLMANALAKFNCGDWQPYAGIGLGWYYMHTKANMSSTWGFLDGRSGSTNKNGFAWQLMAGVDYKIDANWAVFAEYKWLNYQIVSHKNFLFDDMNVLKSRLGQQLLNLGVRYSF